ncbi:hypothetical protein LBMAG42_00340 [Deltaproteobacteria bacterium]|nr:hypothetical protein LBMAG42_00340 [Deltaproteobacteria bacterium]
MIAALACMFAMTPAFAADPTPSRARYQMVVASWERAHGNEAAAKAAAETALLHAPNAGAPRVFLASLLEGEPGALSERLRLLEAAVRDPAVSAAGYTDLGRARAANGDLEGGVGAFRESEARGGGDANYAAWIEALRSSSASWPIAAGQEALARWQAAGGPHAGFYAPFASAVLMNSTVETRDQACQLWRLGSAFGEAVDPTRVVDVCLVDGHVESTAITLFNLGDQGVDVAEAKVRARQYGVTL